MKLLLRRLPFSLVLSVSAILSSPLTSVSLAAPPISRIINGDPAASGEFPWMAALSRRGSTPELSLFCGGALIAPQWVMTAAHCVESTSLPQDIRVSIGKNRLTQMVDSQLVPDGIVIHPLYDPTTLKYDVALVRLTQPHPGPFLNLVDEGDGSNEIPGAATTIMGWGVTNLAEQILPDLLQKASVPVVDDDSCEAAYGLFFRRETQLCAAQLASTPDATDGVDSCSGDSGSPMIVGDSAVGYKAIGLVSSGIGCASSNFPGIYSRISAFANWVKSSPMVAPFPLEGAMISGIPEAGQILTCSPGAYGGDLAPTFTFSWTRVSFSSQVFESEIDGETSAQYLLRDEDVGATLYCTVTATTNLGSTNNKSSETSVIQSPPPSDNSPNSGDTVPPRAKKRGIKCSKTSCELQFNVIDDSGSSNIATVEAFVSRTRSSTCSVKGVKRPCTKTTNSWNSALAATDPIWSFQIARAKVDQQVSLYLRLIDASGNTSTPKRSVSFKIPKLVTKKPS